MWPSEGSHYGASLLAHIAVSKCADVFLLYRLAKGVLPGLTPPGGSGQQGLPKG